MATRWRVNYSDRAKPASLLPCNAPPCSRATEVAVAAARRLILERVRQDIDRAGGVNAVAKEAGISASIISRTLREKTSPTGDSIAAMAYGAGAALTYWYGGLH